MGVSSALGMAHGMMATVVGPGDWVIDATAGNGYDTTFLADLVGPGGRVLAMDVQRDAVDVTKARLEESDWVTVMEGDHGQLIAALDDVWSGRVQGIMFNLGYLPGGDKAVQTVAASTIKALEGSLALLASGGLITLVCYVGHAGGAAEAEAVMEWGSKLDQGAYTVAKYRMVNQRNTPPFLIVVEKR